MIISIRKSIENAYIEYPTIERTAWVQKWPGQSVLCVGQIFWTAEVHGVLASPNPGQMRNYHMFLTVTSNVDISKNIFSLKYFILESVERYCRFSSWKIKQTNKNFSQCVSYFRCSR